MPLSREEKALYHQVHPAKLATDIGSTIVSVYLLWNQNLIAGIVAAFLPPPVASAIVVSFADIEGIRDSPLGRYLKRYMTRPVEALRLAGAVVILAGAWFHFVWAFPVGVAIVLVAWARGRLFPERVATAG